MNQEDSINLENTGISLSVSTWAKLVALVASAVAAFFAMFLQSQATMHELDVKWQNRIVELTREIRHDIKDVETKIPPDWFRKMVEHNKQSIDDLEREFTRDFVRKEELEKIIKGFK